mgnify:CR=1 FL=1
MLKQTLLNLFNEKLAGEMFTYSEVVSYFDLVIDEINADLSSKFPAFTEFTPTLYPGYKAELYTRIENGKEIIDEKARDAVYQNYDFFPDKYLRSVVIPGAAYKWFSVDEEGASTAPLFQAEYEKARFEMVRDYIDLVPYEYQNDISGAITDLFYYDKLTDRSEEFGVF